MNEMATMNELYARHLAIACADDPYDHEAYTRSRTEVERQVVKTYGEALAGRVMEWLDDCNEVPSRAAVYERTMLELRGELEEAAVRAAHATDVGYNGHVDKEPVVQAFKTLMSVVDKMQQVEPQVRRAETLMLALTFGMKEKAADYGVELA